MTELIDLFDEFSSPDEIHSVCRLFYDSYTSGDKKVKLLVTLMLPSMLHAYQAHSNSEVAMTGATKQSSTGLPHVTFTIGDDRVKPNSCLASLAFLLSELCHLAPACLRCPFGSKAGGRFSRNLPDLKINSIFHSGSSLLPPQHTSHKSTTKPPTMPDRLCYADVEREPICSNHTLSSSPPQHPDTACVIRIYVDTLVRQLVDGTREQFGVLLCSIRAFCSLVEHVTSLDAGKRIRARMSDLLIDLIVAIDKILFILVFDGELKGTSDDRGDLSTRVFELLPSVERYASYHCLASVLLINSAVISTWTARLKRPHHHGITPIQRRMRLTSDEPLNSVELSSDSESEGTATTPGGFTSAANTHRFSVFTNANFRAEPVAEDIPMNSIPQESGERKLQHQHRHLHHGLHLSQLLTRSTENLAGDVKNVRRLKLALHRQEKD